MEISLFENVKTVTPNKTIDFDDYINGIKSGVWQDEVLNFRAKKLEKWKIKAVTSSGTFNKRNVKALIKHSGFINIDIDSKDNQDIDLLEFRSELYTDLYIYAGHLSVSGNGLTCYIKINPKKHLESFLAIEKYFANEYNIIIDKACKDISRLRFVSYDPDLHYNSSAKKWVEYLKPIPRVFNNYISTSNDFDAVMQQIISQYVNIAEDYADWIKIGFAIAGEFGEGGRGYFHDISKISTKYDYEKANAKYNNLLKNSSSNKTSIATFFYFAKEAGLKIKTDRTKEIETIAKLRYKSIGENGGIKDKIEARKATTEYLNKIKNIEGKDVEEIINQVEEIPKQFIENQEISKEKLIEEYLISNNVTFNSVTFKLEKENKELNDRIVNDLLLNIKEINPKITRAAFDMVINSSRIPEINPFLEFIKKHKHLKPKGLIDKALNVLNDEMYMDDKKISDYKDIYVRKWLLSIMASIHGTYSLMILVLTGPQMTNKTNWFRFLLPDELTKYYAESKLDLGKDDEILMTDKLLIIDDEFGGKSKIEAKKLKDLSSKQWFTIRRPYGHIAENLKRIAVLGGTSNEDEIINDPTGNRRIIPLKINSIDIEKFKEINKTELLIELYHEWGKIGDGWMLTPEEVKYLNKSTIMHEQSVNEHDLIGNYFEQEDTFFYNIKTVDVKVLIEHRTNQKLSLYKLAQNLKKLGYQQKVKRVGSRITRVWNLQELHIVT